MLKEILSRLGDCLAFYILYLHFHEYGYVSPFPIQGKRPHTPNSPRPDALVPTRKWIYLLAARDDDKWGDSL